MLVLLRFYVCRIRAGPGERNGLRPSAQRRDALADTAGRPAAGGRRGRTGRRVVRRRNGPNRPITEAGICVQFAHQLRQRKRAGPGQQIVARLAFSRTERQIDGTAAIAVQPERLQSEQGV